MDKKENLIREAVDILDKSADMDTEAKKKALVEFTDQYAKNVQWALDVITGAINHSDREGTGVFFYEALGMVRAALGSQLGDTEKMAMELFNHKTHRRMHRYSLSEDGSRDDVAAALEGLKGDELFKKLDELVESGQLKLNTEEEHPQEVPADDVEKEKAEDKPAKWNSSLLGSLCVLVDEYINKIIGLLPDEGDEQAKRREHMIALVSASDLARFLLAEEAPGLLKLGAQCSKIYMDMAPEDNPVLTAIHSPEVDQDCKEASDELDKD
jgi:hypothetical protein